MKVLISGGSGLIGTAITRRLLNEGHDVVHLSRRPDNTAIVKQYPWDIDRQEMDLRCLENTDAIVNLAGATLNHRWTPEYKSLILRSRVDATRLLFKALRDNDHQVSVVVSASASGYYPSDFNQYFNEDDAPGNDFMALVCQKWESEAQNFETLGIRTVIGRIGIVLSDEDGALPAMARPVKFGLGAPLGNGKQFISWIHINDLTRLFLFALENNAMYGPYNFVAPQTLTNRELTKAIAHVLNRPLLLPPVPAFALKLALGEMAEIVLRSNGLDNTRLKGAGFTPEFEEINNGLTDLLK